MNIFLYRLFPASKKGLKNSILAPAGTYFSEELSKRTDKPTILVVEDDATIRLVESERLKMLNCYCLTAANGEQALMLYVSADLILLDIGLPDVTGLEVCRRIRQQPEGKDIPIIAVTGLVSQRTKNQCYEAGMNYFLTKPVSLFELYRVLYYWLPEYRLVIQRVESSHE